MKNGRAEVVKLLIENGADVTDQDNLAIKQASKYGYLEMAKLLILHRADITTEDNLPIKLASEFGHFSIVELLIIQIFISIVNESLVIPTRVFPWAQ